MKKQLHTYISVLIAAVFMLTACSEDFLDKNPYDSVASSEALQSINDCEVALNGVYSGMKGESYYGRYVTLLPDIMTDMVFAANGYSNQLGEMYKYSFTPGTGEVYSVWAQAYSVIARANNIINAIDDIEGDETTKNDIKGQALFARAISHFNLVRFYGAAYDPATASSELGVPVILVTEIAEPSRASVDAVYTQIITDLVAAKGLVSATGTANDAYISKSACDALLARVYLTKQDWTNALASAENVMDNSGYSLIDNGDAYNAMWLNDQGSEIIWRLIYTPTDIGGRLGANYYNDGQGEPWPDYIPANWLLSLYDKTTDFRYEAYFNDNVLTRYGWTGTLIHKYPTNPQFTDNGANMPKPLRFSEMYLIAAEASYKLGDEPGARGYLNDLRKTRILNYLNDNASTGTALEDAIFNERIKELAFEGHYWFDLKRHGKSFTRVPQSNTSVANDLSIAADYFKWLWPIPEDELNGNGNIEPNEGY